MFTGTESAREKIAIVPSTVRTNPVLKTIVERQKDVALLRRQSVVLVLAARVLVRAHRRLQLVLVLVLLLQRLVHRVGRLLGQYLQIFRRHFAAVQQILHRERAGRVVVDALQHLLALVQELQRALVHGGGGGGDARPSCREVEVASSTSLSG